MMLGAALVLLAGAALGADVVFRHVLDDQPLEIKPAPGEQITEAVTQFRATGNNPYTGDQAALDEGKKLYTQWCQVCHLPDGSGRMGAPLNGEKFRYERTSTDVGMFEVIYGGATGAMQPFEKRLKLDQMLKVMAYVRTLKKGS